MWTIKSKDNYSNYFVIKWTRIRLCFTENPCGSYLLDLDIVYKICLGIKQIPVIVIMGMNLRDSKAVS